MCVLFTTIQHDTTKRTLSQYLPIIIGYMCFAFVFFFNVILLLDILGLQQIKTLRSFTKSVFIHS